MLKPHRRFLLVLSAALLAASAGWAAVPASVTPADLMQATPPPPKTVDGAVAAVRDGTIVGADLVAFRQRLQAERSAIAERNGGGYPEPDTAAPVLPATATPAVLSAVRSYSSYLASNSGDRDPAKALSKRSRWVQRAKGQQQRDLAQRHPPCEPCADAAASAENARYLAERSRLIGEELDMWNALFADWQKTRAPWLVTAQAQLPAAVAAASTQQEHAALAHYQAAMLKEVELLYSLTELAVQRADAFISNAGDHMPDALSGATKKPPKP